MNIELNDEEVKKLVEKTIQEKVNSMITKTVKDYTSFYLTDQNLHIMCQNAVNKAINEIAQAEFSTIIETFNKESFTRFMASKIYDYLFDNC